MEPQAVVRPEDALRLLAAAVSAARLYPPASAIPRETAEKFVDYANQLTSSSPFRFGVEPHHFRVEGFDVGVGLPYMTALAESLHALQVRQVITVSGLMIEEMESFISIVISDPTYVTMQGGIRACLAKERVAHMGVVEVSLKSTDEAGLLGMDLLNTPLEDVMGEMMRAAERRVAAAKTESFDEMAAALDRLEAAARELALERVARGFMQYDDRQRMRLLAMALKADVAGQRMDGVLEAFGRMKPAALARLLKLVATQAKVDPNRIAQAMTIPPETASMLATLLRPSPDVITDYQVPNLQSVDQMAQAIRSDDTPAWQADEQRYMADPALAAGRALSVATALSKQRSDEETVKAMADVLPQAARIGAFGAVHEALEHMKEIGEQPALAETVAIANQSLADRGVMIAACRSIANESDSTVLVEIVSRAGLAGSDALLEAYIHSPESHRTLLRPVLRGSSEGILAVARPQLRAMDSAYAMGILRALAALGEKRSIPLIQQTLDQNKDLQVRVTAISCLASMQTEESTKVLIRALGHRDKETQRAVVKQLGRMKSPAAVPALARRFDDVGVLARGHDMRKDIIDAVSMIGTPEAEKVLQRWAARPAFGRKSRELKQLAIEAKARTPKKESTGE